MLDSTFAAHAYESDYPASSQGPASQGSARHDRFASVRTLDLDLSAVATTSPSLGGKLRCEPGEDQQTHVFHWLVFAAAAPAGNAGSSTACDLWRWHRGEWRSVFVAGATFSPEEMYAQGWRYCAPSVQLFVNFVSAPKARPGDAGAAQLRQKQTGMAPPKRNRSLTLAVSAPPPASPRHATMVRRGAIA